MSGSDEYTKASDLLAGCPQPGSHRWNLHDNTWRWHLCSAILCVSMSGVGLNLFNLCGPNLLADQNWFSLSNNFSSGCWMHDACVSKHCKLGLNLFPWFLWLQDCIFNETYIVHVHCACPLHVVNDSNWYSVWCWLSVQSYEYRAKFKWNRKHGTGMANWVLLNSAKTSNKRKMNWLAFSLIVCVNLDIRGNMQLPVIIDVEF